MVATATQEDVLVIPVAPYDPYRLLPRALEPRRRGAFTAMMLCFAAASVAFSVTLAVLLAVQL
jgi:hypothetical protein